MNCQKFVKSGICVMTRIVSLVCTHAIEIGRVFASNSNLLFVAIKFSLEKDFAKFPAFVNFNIMLFNFRS